VADSLLSCIAVYVARKNRDFVVKANAVFFFLDIDVPGRLGVGGQTHRRSGVGGSVGYHIVPADRVAAAVSFGFEHLAFRFHLALAVALYFAVERDWFVDFHEFLLAGRPELALRLLARGFGLLFRTHGRLAEFAECGLRADGVGLTHVEHGLLRVAVEGHFVLEVFAEFHGVQVDFGHVL